MSSFSEQSAGGARFGHAQFEDAEAEGVQELLQKKLGPGQLTSRPGQGGSRFTYIESWKVLQLANRIFGFNGWSCSVVDISPDYVEESRGKVSVGVTAVVRVTLKDGTFHEDVGYGMSENPKKGSAIENAKKEAVSDARKRALRCFGDSLGNCLYDKEHLKKLKNKRCVEGMDLLEEDLMHAGRSVASLTAATMRTAPTAQTQAPQQRQPPVRPVVNSPVATPQPQQHIAQQYRAQPQQPQQPPLQQQQQQPHRGPGQAYGHAQAQRVPLQPVKAEGRLAAAARQACGRAGAVARYQPYPQPNAHAQQQQQHQQQQQKAVPVRSTPVHTPSPPAETASPQATPGSSNGHGLADACDEMELASACAMAELAAEVNDDASYDELASFCAEAEMAAAAAFQHAAVA